MTDPGLLSMHFGVLVGGYEHQRTRDCGEGARGRAASRHFLAIVFDLTLTGRAGSSKYAVLKGFGNRMKR
jgi:hypothetical protein